MWIFCGLGNPGEEYRFTRHNFGFIVLEFFAQKKGLSFKFKPEFEAEIARYRNKALLVKPLTYMNLSGRSIKKVLSKKGSLENLVVIYDDLDLPLGKVKILPKGGSAGHKGVQSIIDALNTKNFPRIKLGIGRPPAGTPVKDYVLSPFTQEEWKVVKKICELVSSALDELLVLGLNKVMTKYNTLSKDLLCQTKKTGSPQ